MERLSWYLKRLSVMGPGEIRHRLGEQLYLRQLAMRQRPDGHAEVPPVAEWRRFAFCDASDRCLPALSWDRTALREASEGWTEGTWPALGFDWCWHDAPDIWRQAPDTGRRWPVSFFSDIPYRAGNPHGDIRVAWEPARLQQLVALALLAEDADGAGADAIACAVEAQFRSWIDANPPYLGIHYISAMECALRLIAVCHAFDLIRARLSEPDTVWPALLRLVSGHAALIERRLSLFSSRGNHTVAECAGLVYAGVLFGEFPKAARWRRKGLRILAREAQHQVLGDGGGIERALHYHRFVIDLLGLVDSLLTHRHMDRPPEIVAALERGRAFLSAVTLPDGETMPVGDGDGGYALSKFLRWPTDAGQESELAEHYGETGYSVVRSSAPQSTLLFDHGPLGMAPSYGHAHGDALSVILHSGGEPILADCGTFTYTGEAKWREYFRATRAHNTVCMDGGDQAVQETAFQWSSPFDCGLIGAERSDDGIHLLLGRLATADDGYIHLRGVATDPGSWIYVWDRIEGQGDSATLHWHCAAPVRKTDDPLCFVLDTAAGPMTMTFKGDGADPDVVTGESEPPMGWLSRDYGRMEPCSVIRRIAATLPVTFGTVLILSGDGPPEAALSETISLWQRWARDAGPN